MPSGYTKNGKTNSGSFKKGHNAWNKGLHTGFIPKNGFKKGIINFPDKKLPKGKNHHNWKGGQLTKDGYIYILKPNHPFCNNLGYIKRSRLAMEKVLCRYLKPTERVHHINGKHDDDRPKNLRLFSNESEHQKFHHPKGIYASKKVFY